MTDADELFSNENPIFRNKELLRVEHLPEGDKIIGRDGEIEQLANALREATNGGTPNNVLVYGKTGTGKSLCTKYVTNKTIPKAKESGYDVGVAYIDCLQQATENDLLTSIAMSLKDQSDVDVSVPAAGISTSQYYNRLWKILDNAFDVVVIVFDEVDKMGDDDGEKALMLLSRAVEAEKVENCKIGLVGISNDIRYKDEIGERLKSSLGEQEFVFTPYDADQLRNILYSRESAFVDGVLSDEVIPKAGAIAAREHGDARKAIDILRYAGEIASNRDDEMVEVSHVEEAREREEEARLAQLISGQPDHSKYLLRALAKISEDRELESPEVPTKEVFGVYEAICEPKPIDALKIRRVRDLLEELEFLSLIEQQYISRGQGRGGYMVNQLVDTPELVLRAVEVSDR